MRPNLLLGRSSCTSLARQRDLHSINIKSKVLQTMRVAHSLCRVVLSQLQAFRVGICVMLGGTFADFSGVVETVHQVCCEVGCELVVGNGIAVTAHGLKGLACGVGERADDCFIGGVFTAPVTTPAYKGKNYQCWCENGQR